MHDSFPPWRIVAACTAIFLLSVGPAQGAERKLTDFKPFSASVPANFTCRPDATVIVRALDDAAFTSNRVELQKLIGGIRAILGFECPNTPITNLLVVGEAGGKEVYRGSASGTGNWLLADLRPPVTASAPAEQATLPSVPERVTAPEQTLIQNGSFELGVNIPDNPGYLPLSSGSTTINNWTVIQGGIDYYGTGWVASNGRRSLDLNGTPGIGGVAQKFATKPGQKYRVRFDMAGHISGLLQTMRVSAAGQSHAFTFQSRTDPHNLGWQTQKWEFTAIASETRLAFYSLQTGYPFGGPALDNVYVTQVGAEQPASQVPAPGRVCMFYAPNGGFVWGLIAHVGWAFQDGMDRWVFGATENTSGQTDINSGTSADTQSWLETGTWEQVLSAFRTGQNYNTGPSYYQSYRCINIKTSYPAIARTQADVGQKSGYHWNSDNCLTKSVDIFRAYGVTKLPPAYHTEPFTRLNKPVLPSVYVPSLLTSAGFEKAQPLSGIGGGGAW